MTRDRDQAGGRAVHSPPRHAPPRARALRHLRRRHRQPVFSPPTRPPRSARWKCAPTACSRPPRSTASTIAIRSRHPDAKMLDARELRSLPRRSPGRDGLDRRRALPRQRPRRFASFAWRPETSGASAWARHVGTTVSDESLSRRRRTGCRCPGSAPHGFRSREHDSNAAPRRKSALSSARTMWQSLPEFGTGVLYAILVAAAYTFAVSLAAGRGQPRLLAVGALRRVRHVRRSRCSRCCCSRTRSSPTTFAFATSSRYSDRSMPTTYLFTALWGGQDGSLLWWSFLLVGLHERLRRLAQGALPRSSSRT